MCFSPEADLLTGTIASTAGIIALRHVTRPQQLVLAASPLLLGAHQIGEAFVWWGLRGQLPRSVTQAAVYAFVAIAFALPFLVPLATVGIEPILRRRRLMAVLLVVGALTTSALIVAIVREPVSATIQGHVIAYTTRVTYGTLLGLLYALTTCGALLIASSRLFVVLGMVNLGAVIGLRWITFTGFTSLWCAWAALTSISVAWYLRRIDRPPQPTGASAATIAHH